METTWVCPNCSTSNSLDVPLLVTGNPDSVIAKCAGPSCGLRSVLDFSVTLNATPSLVADSVTVAKASAMFAQPALSTPTSGVVTNG